MGICTLVNAQIPVEVFGGHQRTTVDVMFFKFLKGKQERNSAWLFFNRNRASVDYRMTRTTQLPQFGFTEAISYNHGKLKGFAPVYVAQILSWGVYSKAGIQYAYRSKEFTFFSWFVCETAGDPDLDYFLLVRYTPKLTAQMNLFSQFESINTLPTLSTSNFSFTQRMRLGIQLNSYQLGVGADLNQIGNTTYTNTNNFGCFVRHEF